MRSVEARIADARDHARMALELGYKLDRRALSGDITTYHALLFELMVIGEALNHVPPEIRAMAPTVR